MNTASKQGERLQKILSQKGLGSRREIETWIQAGRIKINGKIASLGDRALPSDAIEIDNKKIVNEGEIKTEVLLYYKPEGEICSRKDPQHPHTVFDHLPSPQKGRWIMVGRLDLNTSGLLLFTNDGALANRLMHPRHEIEREYAVRIFGHLSAEHIQDLKNGVRLEDGPAHFSKISDQGGEGANHWYHVVISEGRNREIRRMFECLNLQVSRLIRIRFGSVLLPPTLRRGEYQLLSATDLKTLKNAADYNAAKHP